MPIYEYECQKCGEVFETIQKFSDPRLTECLCEEKGPVTKLISAAAFHLKGSGWYVTDFRDKGKGKGKDGKDDAKGADAGGESDAKSGNADKAAKEGGEPGSSDRKEPAKEAKSGSGSGPAAKAAAD